MNLSLSLSRMETPADCRLSRMLALKIPPCDLRAREHVCVCVCVCVCAYMYERAHTHTANQ